MLTLTATIIALAASAIPDQSGDLLVRGSTLHYVVSGKGQPCLVIGSSLYYPRTFSRQLRQRLEMYFVDLPWFARSLNGNVSSYSLKDLIEDVDQIRSKLRLEKPVLMGHSIHGTIAFEYARKHPEHVSGLVLIGSPVLIGSDKYEESAAEKWKTATSERRSLQDSNWRHLPDFKKHPELQPDVENYLAMAPKYWANPHYDARWLWAGMTVQADALHHLFGDLFKNYHMFASERSVPSPTFVATGLYDYVIPCETWLKDRDVPNLTIHLFKHSGHTPQLEEPAMFDHALLTWLAAGKVKLSSVPQGDKIVNTLTCTPFPDPRKM